MTCLREDIGTLDIDPSMPEVHPYVREALDRDFKSKKRDPTKAILELMGRNPNTPFRNADIIRNVAMGDTENAANMKLANLEREFEKGKSADNGFYITRTTQKREGHASPMVFYTLVITNKAIALSDDPPKPSTANEIHPWVLEVCERDIREENGTRKILEFMGRNPSVPTSCQDIKENIDIPRNDIYERLNTLIKLAGKHREQYGFYIEKTNIGSRQVRFILRLLPDRKMAPEGRQTRLGTVYNGDPVTRVTDEMRQSVSETLRKLGINIPIMTASELGAETEYIRGLLAKATWMIRVEKPEHPIIERLLSNPDEAFRTYEILREFDIGSKQFFHCLAERMEGRRAVDLGFVVAQARRGFFAAFVLDKRKRMETLLTQGEAIYAENTIPFDYEEAGSRLSANVGKFSKRQEAIIKYVAQRQKDGNPTTAREIRDQFGFTPKQICLDVEKTVANRGGTGMYMRYREDTKMEVVLLNLSETSIDAKPSQPVLTATTLIPPPAGNEKKVKSAPIVTAPMSRRTSAGIINRLTREVGASAVRLAAAKNENESLKEDFERATALVVEELNAVKAQLTGAKADIDRLRAALSAATAENTEMDKEVRALSGAKARLKQELAEKEESIEKLAILLADTMTEAETPPVGEVDIRRNMPVQLKREVINRILAKKKSSEKQVSEEGKVSTGNKYAECEALAGFRPPFIVAEALYHVESGKRRMALLLVNDGGRWREMPAPIEFLEPFDAKLAALATIPGNGGKRRVWRV